MTTFLEKIHDRKTKSIELVIHREKGKTTLSVVSLDSDEEICLRTFKNDADYKRFLVEAVLLRIATHNSALGTVRGWYRNFVKFFQDNSRKTVNFLFCLLFSFGLTACSAVSTEHSVYEFTTDQGSYRCEYDKGTLLKCVKLVEDENV